MLDIPNLTCLHPVSHKSDPTLNPYLCYLHKWKKVAYNYFLQWLNCKYSTAKPEKCSFFTSYFVWSSDIMIGVLLTTMSFPCFSETEWLRCAVWSRDAPCVLLSLSFTQATVPLPNSITKCWCSEEELEALQWVHEWRGWLELRMWLLLSPVRQASSSFMIFMNCITICDHFHRP